jgi:hypothetical protein
MTDTRLGPTGRSFGTALEHIKAGGRAARAGWNGKGMWICLGNGQIIHAQGFWNKHTKAFALEQPNQQAEVLPYLIMKTADNKVLMGWLASQSDCLSEDWCLLD